MNRDVKFIKTKSLESLTENDTFSDLLLVNVRIYSDIEGNQWVMSDDSKKKYMIINKKLINTLPINVHLLVNVCTNKNEKEQETVLFVKSVFYDGGVK